MSLPQAFESAIEREKWRFTLRIVECYSDAEIEWRIAPLYLHVSVYVAGHIAGTAIRLDRPDDITEIVDFAAVMILAAFKNELATKD